MNVARMRNSRCQQEEHQGEDGGAATQIREGIREAEKTDNKEKLDEASMQLR